jgi:hypothetical protein
MTRAVPLAQMNSGVVVDGAAGTAKSFYGTTAQSVRWEMDLGDATAESGSNTGSNLAIKAYADNGATLLSTPLTINRASGLLALSGDPTAALGVATKQYVDVSAASAANNARSGVNRLINGDMRTDQRNNGASGTATQVYTVDRWFYNSNQIGKGTWGRSSPGPSGFPYYLFFNSSSAYASLAGDNFGFFQRIEADNVSDFCWGTANAQPVTLSFWALSSLTGTFGGAITNQPSPGTRSYPFSFSLTANVWTKIVITIPGDTAGTWVMSGNAAGILLVFDLGSGSTLRGPANVWAAANYWGVTGTVSLVATNGAGIEITGVKLEIGSIATPFVWEQVNKAILDCQRYYTLGASAIWSGSITTGSTIWTFVPFGVPMRATPTVICTDIGSNNGFPATAPSVQGPTGRGFQAFKTPNGSGASGYFMFNYTAAAEL